VTAILVMLSVVSLYLYLFPKERSEDLPEEKVNNGRPLEKRCDDP